MLLALVRHIKIEALQNEDGIWLHEDHDIRILLVQSYHSLFTSTSISNHVLYSQSSYPLIPDNDMILFNADISCEDVKRALFSMANFKSPSWDGFHPIFFKSKWDVLGPSIVQFVKDVFSNHELIGSMNNTLLTLIPKHMELARAADFRPIALCNVIYKVVTKVVSNRIRHILPHIISGFQSSFIRGRNTTDNTLILQEMVHSMQHISSNKGFMVVKLDLQKTYDMMEWHFIIECLNILQLPSDLISVISACISTPSMRLNWCGRPSNDFIPSRGIRQGDPISPYLFVIAMERLSHCIIGAVNYGAWLPMKFGRDGLAISHLMFADDILLIFEASSDQAS